MQIISFDRGQRPKHEPKAVRKVQCKSLAQQAMYRLQYGDTIFVIEVQYCPFSNGHARPDCQFLSERKYQSNTGKSAHLCLRDQRTLEKLIKTIEGV